jgi:multidrug efflux system membrane fusion protein
MRVWTKGLLGIGGLALVLGAYHALDTLAPAAPQPIRAPHLVSASRAESRDMPVELRGLGTVDSLDHVDIRSRVDGAIMAIRFAEGQNVRSGDVLIEIDPRPYQAEVAAAEAGLARDQALLESAKADMGRVSDLAERGYRTRKDFDTQKASVGQLEASIRGDGAQIEMAKLRLAYATIRSPIDGRVGRIQVDLGNVVTVAGDKPLVSVTKMNPIAVTFSVAQDLLPAVQRRMGTGDLLVEARTTDDRETLARGRLTLIGDAVDRNSGTIALKAVFENAESRLWPGQFVNAHLLLDTASGAVVVPEAAVVTGASGPLVYVITPQSRIALRHVETGIRSGGRIEITKGIAVGETVVLSGQDSVEDGSPVTVSTRATGA